MTLALPMHDSMHFSDSAVRPCRAALCTALFLLACLASPVTHAHKASDAFLELRVEDGAISVRWDIALRDLDQVLDLDGNGNSVLEWSEIAQRQAAIRDYALPAIDFATAAGACEHGAVAQSLARRGDGAYAVLQWRVQCPRPAAEVQARYRLLAAIDPTHRAIVSVPGATVALLTLRPSDEPQTIGLESGRAEGASYDFAGFFIEGFRHILYGADHLAFLVALLIPAIAVATAGDRSLGITLAGLLKIVSVFTLAHCITLGLTAFDLIGLPSRLVESLVALSVVVAGLQGLLVGLAASGHPPARRWRWRRRLEGVPTWLVFAFGLIHGIGFGTALDSAGFEGRAVMAALLGFNVGVEAGQLAVLAVIFPLVWALRESRGFNRVALPAAALAVVVAGAAWLSARAFDVDLPALLAS